VGPPNECRGTPISGESSPLRASLLQVAAAGIGPALTGQELRCDAARNRQSIVDTARRYFASDGLDVPLDSIARRAGVGGATLYRRFPRRDDLVEACMADRMVAYLNAVREALADPDPWQGFVSYLTTACAMQAGDRGVNDLLTRTFPTSRRLEGLRRRAHASLRELMERAQRQGALRGDVTVDDIPLLLLANAGIVRTTFGTAPDAWRRALGITIDGLRSEGRTPLPPAPTRRQLLRSLVRASRRTSQ
jgi:AcrR family transcriptional regulator